MSVFVIQIFGFCQSERSTLLSGAAGQKQTFCIYVTINTGNSVEKVNLHNNVKRVLI